MKEYVSARKYTVFFDRKFGKKRHSHEKPRQNQSSLVELQNPLIRKQSTIFQEPRNAGFGIV